MQVSLECTHKQLRLFRLAMDARTVVVLLIILMLWQIMKILHIL